MRFDLGREADGETGAVTRTDTATDPFLDLRGRCERARCNPWRIRCQITFDGPSKTGETPVRGSDFMRSLPAGGDGRSVQAREDLVSRRSRRAWRFRSCGRP